MRFLKQKTLSKYSPSDQSLFTNHFGRAVMQLTGGLRLPKGTTAQRPQLSGVRTTGAANGFMRYNTTTNSIEAYIDGVWEVVCSLAKLGGGDRHPHAGSDPGVERVDKAVRRGNHFEDQVPAPDEHCHRPEGCCGKVA